MPIYEYVCTNEECDNDVFEELRPISKRDKVTICPICYAQTTTRNFTTGGIVYENEESRKQAAGEI